ncbi:MAG TPA: glycosyltransferase [Solirubrobacteraceae bacterium]|nr:glycosyltransferase [Solirubrobacteraceae bacterium]
MLTILIPNYGRTRYVERLVRQLVAEPEVASGQVRVLVSDNSSPTETQRMLRALREEFAHLQLEVHEQDSNIGGQENVKWLVNHADTSHVWLIGNDDTIEPGAVAYVLALLAQYDPGVLHLPHSWEFGEKSRRPSAPHVMASGRELFLEYTHWLSFMSSCVVRRTSLLQAIEDAPALGHAWSPHIWYAVAGRGERCVVADRLLVHVGDARGWFTHHVNDLLTIPLITAFDEGFALLVNEWEYGRLFLDRRDADWHTPLWTLGQLSELMSAVRRFPSSRWLRRRLFELVISGDPAYQVPSTGDALELIVWAVRETEDAGELSAAIGEAESEFLAGNLARSVSLFQAILAIDPANVEVLCDLGVAAIALGSNDGIQAIEYAIQCDPQHADSYANRALWAQQQGLRSLALTDARHAVELEPSLEPVLAAILAG